MKKSLNITFINHNTEEQIVQAMAGVLAYNLAENDANIKFDYKNSNTYQNSHKEIEDEYGEEQDIDELFEFIDIKYKDKKSQSHADAYKDQQGYEWVSNDFY